MADEVIPTGKGEGVYGNADYLTKGPDFKELQDVTINVTNGFSASDFSSGSKTDIPAGSYKIVSQDYSSNGDLYVTLEDGSGNKYNVPNNFFSSDTVTVTDTKGNTYQAHGSYIDLWANSHVTGNGQGKPTGVSAELLSSSNTKAGEVGYNTYKETTYAEKSVYGDNVELGLETRTADDINGQKVSVDGRVYDVPYKVGEVVIASDGKQYRVETYTAQTDDGYKVSLKPIDGGDAVEVSTKDMIDNKYKVVTSAIEKGSEFGYHADEKAVQDTYKTQRDEGKLTLSNETMSISDMQAGKRTGNFLCQVTTSDGKEVDAYVTFSGDGRDPVIVDRKTGEVLKGVNNEVKVYTRADEDHNAISTSYGGVTTKSKVPEGAIQSGNDYYLADNSPKNKVGNQYIYTKADGTKVVVTYESNDGAAGYGNRPGLVTGTYKDADGNTYHLSNDQIQGCSKVEPTTGDPVSYNSGSGYDVTSIITDKGIDRGTYNTGDGWFYDPASGAGALNATGATATSREKSEMYDDAMFGHNLTEHASLVDLVKGIKYSNPQDAIAALVSTKHWTRQDATIFVNDAIAQGLITVEAGFAEKDAYYPPYASVHGEFKGEGSLYGARAASLASEVEVLRKNSDNMLLQMDDWRGKSKKMAAANIAQIEGRILQTMNNIESRLQPACAAIAELDAKLSQLEAEDKVLAELIKDRDAKETAMNNAKAAWEKEPATTTKETKNDDGTTTKEEVTNNNKAALKTTYDNATTAYNEAAQKVKDQQKKECEMEQEILGLIETVKGLDQSMSSLGEHVNPDGAFSDAYTSPEEFAKRYQDLFSDFQNTNRFPTITNLSDYKLGDLITLDDSYGYLYKVVEVFDGDGNATGSIKIVRCDASGKPIPGSSILTIHDQREISPVRGELGTTLWTPPITIEHVTTEPATTEPATTEPNKPGGGNPDKPEVPVVIPETTPQTTVPPVTTQLPTTEPIIPVTTEPSPTPTYAPTNIPLPDPTLYDPTRIPDPDIPTAPGTQYIPDDSGIYMPYTGIDKALDSAPNGDMKRAGVGALGALAGVMAGAAGIGLTALAGDKKEKEEEATSEETSQEQ